MFSLDLYFILTIHYYFYYYCCCCCYFCCFVVVVVVVAAAAAAAAAVIIIIIIIIIIISSSSSSSSSRSSEMRFLYDWETLSNSIYSFLSDLVKNDAKTDHNPKLPNDPHPASNALSGPLHCSSSSYTEVAKTGRSLAGWSAYLGGTCTITKVTVAAKGLIITAMIPYKLSTTEFINLEF